MMYFVGAAVELLSSNRPAPLFVKLVEDVNLMLKVVVPEL
jgi:hypothetical protein